MKLYLAVIFGLGLLFTSCEKQKTKKYDTIKNPTDKSIDVNGDGITDFDLIYTRLETEDAPNSPTTISLHIIGDASNRILKDTINETALFLGAGDSIFHVLKDTTHIWTDTTQILTRSWDGKNWEKYWSINATRNKPYDLIYRVIQGPLNLIGWAQLNINQDNGEVNVVTFDETTNPNLLITYH